MPLQPALHYSVAATYIQQVLYYSTTTTARNPLQHSSTTKPHQQQLNQSITLSIDIWALRHTLRHACLHPMNMNMPLRPTLHESVATTAMLSYTAGPSRGSRARRQTRTSTHHTAVGGHRQDQGAVGGRRAASASMAVPLDSTAQAHTHSKHRAAAAPHQGPIPTRT